MHSRKFGARIGSRKKIVGLIVAVFGVVALPFASPAVAAPTASRATFWVTYRIATPHFLLPDQIQSYHEFSTSRLETSVLQTLGNDPLIQAQSVWLANSSLMQLTNSQYRRLMREISPTSEVASVIPANRPGRLLSFTYGLKRIKIPEMRGRYLGIDGRGVTIGVIDTGGDARHPDIAGRVRAYKDFIDPRITVARDDHGHGTHVAGTAAGTSVSGTSIGVAPGAELVLAKAFDRSGNSKDSDLLAAMQWMIDPDGDPATNDAPKVINSSWNVDGDISLLDPTTEPFCVAVANLRQLGIASVVAAGNDGPRANTIKIPSACPGAITVAATDSRDQVTSFSSRGPVKWKTVTLDKPTVSAPGDGVNSAEPGGGYRTRSGTSMASPHVAGLVALMYQRQPMASVDEIETAIAGSTLDISGTGFDHQTGWGLIDSFKTIDQF